MQGQISRAASRRCQEWAGKLLCSSLLLTLPSPSDLATLAKNIIDPEIRFLSAPGALQQCGAQIHKHEELAITGCCLPRTIVLRFALGTSECTQGTEVASVSPCKGAHLWKSINEFNEGFFLSQSALLAITHFICMSRGQKSSISSAEEALTPGSLKQRGSQPATIAVLSFQTAPKRTGERLNVQLGDGILTLTQFGNMERTTVQYIKGY